MNQTAKLHWPTIAALGILFLLVAALLNISLRSNANHLVYALDDPYIHMSMARNFARHGVWGVTRYEFSSSTSSLLWTLLLSGIDLFTQSSLVPLLFNVALAILLLVSADHFFRRTGLGAVSRLILLIALVVLTPLPPLILTGMEHTAHALITFLFVLFAAEVISRETVSLKNPRFQVLLLLSILAPAVRYEALALVFIATFLLMLRGRLLATLAIALAGIAPVAAYGWISVRNGSLWLPNSILLKASVPSSGFVQFLESTYAKAIGAPHLILILAIAICLFLYHGLRERKFWQKELLLLLFLITAIVLHLLFAATGWFYRYEAYLVALGILINGSLLMQILTRGGALGLATVRFALLVLSGFAIFSLSLRGVRSITETPQATTNIYQQQYQMAAFLNRYYQGAPVAANDIGAITYFADIKLLDLWGLGNAEVTRAKLKRQYSTQKMVEFAKNRGVRIALIYSVWFEKEGGVPKDWIKVGEWTTPNCIVCGYPIVSFYALEANEVAPLRTNLDAFAKELPTGVVYSN